MMNKERLVLTRREGAEAVGVGLSTFDKLLRRKENPVPSLRVGRKIVIPKEQFKMWLEAEGSRGFEGWQGGELHG